METGAEAPSEAERVKLEADTAILAAVDSGLDSLGEPAKDSIFFVLKSTYGMDRFGVPDDPERFLYALRSTLGLSSAVLLRAISKQLQRTKPKDDQVRAAVTAFAKEVDDALYGVEHGLG